MTDIPDLWWSPTHGLIKREEGLYWLLTNGPLLEDGMPVDAVRLDKDRGTDYIRVGEMVSTQDGSDSYRLALGPQRMYLEPVDFGEPHVIELDGQGWTIKHPVICRTRIFDCPVHQAALNSEQLGDRLGRFYCTIDDESFLVIGEEVS